MSIQREGYGELYDCRLTCDMCGEQVNDAAFETYYQARGYAQSNGWKVYRNEFGEWEDICPECRRLGSSE